MVPKYYAAKGGWKRDTVQAQGGARLGYEYTREGTTDVSSDDYNGGAGHCLNGGGLLPRGDSADYRRAEGGREHAFADGTTADFRDDNSRYYTDAGTGAEDSRLGGCRIGLEGDFDWLGGRGADAGWAICEPADCRRADAGGCGDRDDGGADNGLVSAGFFEVADGDRHNGVEVYADTAGVHFFLCAGFGFSGELDIFEGGYCLRGVRLLRFARNDRRFGGVNGF